MYRIRTAGDIEECKALWKKLMPTELVSDLWEVRACFHDQYRHRPHFVIAEEDGRVIGFLPLSWNEETGQFNYFPGETWEGKTWLEQNRIVVSDSGILDDMLASLERPYHLRYLRKEGQWNSMLDRVDEVGFLFLPEQYGFDTQKYLAAFSHKSAKRLRKELAGWDTHRVEWRFNRMEDFEVLCQMNRSRFGRLSYFDDERFLKSFRSLVHLLHDRDWLRVVTVLVDGEAAAVDIGSIYSSMLTMLAGGTNENFPGIAKLINMHHISSACQEHLESVDFLCGDFNWKTLFHLTPMPLYVLDGTDRASLFPVNHVIAGYHQQPDMRGGTNV